MVSRLGRKIAPAGIGILLSIVLALFIIPSFFYPLEYVRRVVFWRGADIYNYQRFPERIIEKGDFPYHFAREVQEARVRDFFRKAGLRDPLDSFLAAAGTQAFIVIHDDKVLYERYFNAALPDQYYKYFWWGMRRNGAKNDFFARGNHGQFIYVSPSKNLIIIRNGERYGVPAEDWVGLFYKSATYWG